MKKILLLGLSAFALSACSGSPISTFGPDDGNGGGGGDVPVTDGDTPLFSGPDVCSGDIVCSGDVRDVQYDAANDVISIRGTPFDETALLGTFVRADEVNNALLEDYDYDYASDNVNGFAAYENDDPLALKPYLAIYETSDDGSISVGQVSIMQGYRDYGYSGYFYTLNDPGSLPTEELALYSGEYAGIVALSGDAEIASATFTSGGTVNFEVDFTDGYISGYTTDRTIDGVSVENLVFDDATFTGNSYAGESTSIGDAEDNWGGAYQGFFGGNQAETTGGVFVVEKPDFFESDGENDEFTVSARETGTFLATKDDRTPIDRTTTP